jgi:histone H2A
MAPKNSFKATPTKAGGGRGEKKATPTKVGSGRGEKKRMSMSAKAEVTFPVARILNKLKKGKYADRIGKGAGIYLASVMEYLVAEILELSGNEARDAKKKIIKPRHIQLALRKDLELDKLVAGVIIPDGGIVSQFENGIHPFLLPKQKGSKKK